MRVYVEDNKGNFIDILKGVDDRLRGRPTIQVAIATRMPKFDLSSSIPDEKDMAVKVITLKRSEDTEVSSTYVLDKRDYAAFREHVRIRRELKRIALS
jgi:hypothetical protein